MQTKFHSFYSTNPSRESLVGSALARLHNASIKFNEDPEKLKYWDYILYSIDEGWAAKCEQQEIIYLKAYMILCALNFTHHNDKKTGQITL